MGSGSLSDGGTGGWALMRTWRCGILFLQRRCGIREVGMFQNENWSFFVLWVSYLRKWSLAGAGT